MWAAGSGRSDAREASKRHRLRPALHLSPAGSGRADRSRSPGSGGAKKDVHRGQGSLREHPGPRYLLRSSFAAGVCSAHASRLQTHPGLLQLDRAWAEVAQVASLGHRDTWGRGHSQPSARALHRWAPPRPPGSDRRDGRGSGRLAGQRPRSRPPASEVRSAVTAARLQRPKARTPSRPPGDAHEPGRLLSAGAPRRGAERPLPTELGPAAHGATAARSIQPPTPGKRESLRSPT